MEVTGFSGTSGWNGASVIRTRSPWARAASCWNLLFLRVSISVLDAPVLLKMSINNSYFASLPVFDCSPCKRHATHDIHLDMCLQWPLSFFFCIAFFRASECFVFSIILASKLKNITCEWGTHHSIMHKALESLGFCLSLYTAILVKPWIWLNSILQPIE